MTISVSHPNWDLDAPQPDLLLAKLSHLGLIRICGEQGHSFIQGQVTTDISSLGKDQWRWGAHCDPKGKMLASFRIFDLDDSLFMLLPSSSIGVDLPQLQKYAVFSKAELSDVSGDWQLFGVAGDKAERFIHDTFAVTSDGAAMAGLTPIEGGAILKDGSRYLLMLSSAAAAAFEQRLDTQVYDASAWQALEILAAYPNLGAEHAGQYVPQMCNLQAIDGISFTKGCYMGQETIARMKYRGGNKRALYVLAGHTEAELGLDTKLEIALEDGFRRAGQIIEYVQRGQQVLLTAVLANDTQADARLRVADDAASSLRVLALPYSLQD
ncbi:tRNA-modifying protein YgfZ [Shewanella salipaludis]|uniref:tRNA-modifying protein YgfZ n=1 Tax=Shewanella salipaludis TaxID=2723052 RepID=A0A972G023_9GAMM|nr:tRNA-modifying protein YgfZ [Shewanella salipaludis]NMH65852.1 tRNA-modifying protein YgfZ [Shewanella salipaludis]